MAKRSKRYRTEAEQLAKKAMSLAEAVEKVKSFDSVKFDQSVECVLQLGIDPKQADQLVRSSISLPHGIGRSKKVVVFCEEQDIETAKDAGAVEAGSDELIKKIEQGWSDFDVAIASAKMMSKVSKLGRILGPQGKMPSPKNGTVTNNIATAVTEFAAGKIEFRNDAGGNVHVVVGKQSFEAKKLVDNIDAFVSYIKKIKPATVKGTFIKKMCISAAMSPAIMVSI
ncbi:MAG: 50S ribosomal protein L1 [Sedimentisphaerales bacterium]|nr:50S ribosomal protein L1 [Sedimentisphaerales bacterium]